MLLTKIMFVSKNSIAAVFTFLNLEITEQGMDNSGRLILHLVLLSILQIIFMLLILVIDVSKNSTAVVFMFLNLEVTDQGMDNLMLQEALL